VAACWGGMEPEAGKSKKGCSLTPLLFLYHVPKQIKENHNEKRGVNKEEKRRKEKETKRYFPREVHFCSTNVFEREGVNSGLEHEGWLKLYGCNDTFIFSFNQREVQGESREGRRNREADIE
jgi:hypothetical protein